MHLHRYTGTSVDPNLKNIAKLPRDSSFLLFGVDTHYENPHKGYADFGHLKGGGEATVPATSKASQQGLLKTRTSKRMSDLHNH
jgi:hypothetical protein